MAKIKGAILVDVENCKGCGLCVVSCPTTTLDLAKQVNGKGYHYAYMIHPDNCIGCANCGVVCPDTVITVHRQKRKKAVTAV